MRRGDLGRDVRAAQVAPDAAEGLMIGIVAGTLTGAALGALAAVAVCLGLEQYAGVPFGKEPLGWAVGAAALGGLLGGLVGRWSVREDPRRLRRPDD